MQVSRFIALIAAACLLLPGCSAPSTQPTTTSAVKTETAVPTNTKVVEPVVSSTATKTPRPSATVDKKGWETPPSEVLLIFDPTKRPNVPHAATFTAVVAKRKFTFAQPEGFRFRDTSYQALMENKEKNILISLELFDHQGKGDGKAFLAALLQNFQFNATGAPEAFDIDGHPGWKVSIETSSIYKDSTGQVFVVEFDDSNFLYATALAKDDQWEARGEKIFNEIIDSLVFLSIE